MDQLKEEARRSQRELELVYQQNVMPGVVDYLTDARQLGLKIGLASSSSYAWVGGHLTRLGLLNRFDVIRTNEDVRNAKPEPDLFLAALEGLKPPQNRLSPLKTRTTVSWQPGAPEYFA